MLTPSNRVVLLPCDREIIELAGLTESEYREFVRQCKFESKIRPGAPVALDPVTLGIILVATGAALFAAGTLLAPKQKSTAAGGRGGIESQARQGQSVVDGRRFAPKAGFDSLQNVVELGSTVPLIYTRREDIGGFTYGGIRVNTNLLWSQVLSLGGDQLLRAIFLVGEGDSRTDSMELDASQFALGNNLMGTYDLTASSEQSRVSIYYSNDGGRLVDADHIAGRIPANDPGNSQTGDVFAVRNADGVYAPDFCYANKPSTQTSFGLFSWIGNAVGFKTNPSLRPATSPSLVPTSNAQVFKISCGIDGGEKVRRKKDEFNFPTRAGITAGAGTVEVGDEITYRLSSAVSRDTDFTYTDTSPNIVGDATATLSSNDVNGSVATRQTSFDEAIVKGELYRIGSALAVCTDRTGQPFVSGGQSVDATFEVVRGGQISGSGTDGTGAVTDKAQIFRISLGSFVTEYPCQALEIGLKSTLGMTITGVTNTTELNSDFETIDNDACLAHDGKNIESNNTLVTQNFQAGQITVKETRYSFFRIKVRIAGTNDPYAELPDLFGARGETSQATYSYIRLEMPDTRRWEFEIEPVSGWEIRKNYALGVLQVLDPRIDTEEVVPQTAGPYEITVRYRGESVSRGINTFEVQLLNPLEQKLWFDENNRADKWTRLAEATSMNEISTTVGGNPEHEIVYINTILPNPVPADYADMAIVGMNIRASREFANLAQFSVYMNRGLGGFHDFPNVLKDILTNTRYGVGEIVSPEQIDESSFATCTTWTVNRRYFFDQAIDSRLNIRDWATTTARHFLLDLIIRNGRWALEPLVEFSGPEPITGLFTAGNIIADTLELNYFSQDQRQQPRISVKWRQEVTTGDVANRGLFPVVREVTVAELSAGVNAPREELDLSDFCTSQVQAIDRAKFECLFRRLSTHSVKFKTTTDQAVLDLGKCFKLGIETLVYDQPQNGYISRDGTVTSWPELPDGTYQALVWDGSTQAVQEQKLTIDNGKSGTARGSVFCVADTVAKTQTYKVQALAFDEDGNLEVEAIQWPTDADGVSLIATNFADSNFAIEGKV